MTKAFFIVKSGNLMAQATVDMTSGKLVSATKDTFDGTEASIINVAADFINNNTNASKLCLVFGNSGPGIKGKGILKYYGLKEDVDCAVAAMTTSQYCTEDLVEAVQNFAEAIYAARERHQFIDIRKASTLKKWEIEPGELADKTAKELTFVRGETEDGCWKCKENPYLTGTFTVFTSGGKFSVRRYYTGTDLQGNEVTLEAFEAIQREDIEWDESDLLPIGLLDAQVAFLPKLATTRKSFQKSATN